MSCHVLSVVPRRVMSRCVAPCRIALCRTAAFCRGCHLVSRTLTLPSSSPHLLTMRVDTTLAFFTDDSHSSVFLPPTSYNFNFKCGVIGFNCCCFIHCVTFLLFLLSLLLLSSLCGVPDSAQLSYTQLVELQEVQVLGLAAVPLPGIVSALAQGPLLQLFSRRPKARTSNSRAPPPVPKPLGPLCGDDARRNWPFSGV